MAHLTWPGTLPQEFQLGTRRGLQDAALRTKMDAGAPKMRPKFTAESTFIDANLVMTGAQYADLDEFYRLTSEKGTHRFDWDDPLDDTTKEVRFTAPPRATLSRGELTNAGDALWTVTFQIELLPGAPPRVTPGPALLNFFIPEPTLVHS